MNELISVQRELPRIAAKRLREIIVDNNMQPGDRFPSESELISMFGVSRSTIREAMKLLVAENIVDIQRGKGTFIAAQPGVVKDPLGLHFSDQQKLLQNLLETRLIIEPQIAYLATQRATQENIKALEHIVQDFKVMPDLRAQHITVDINFHTAVAQCTQNDVLHRFLPVICESIHEGYYETVTIEGSQQRALECHINIFEAIKNRLPEIARSETEKHILQTAKDAKLTLGGK
ncbi:FadR/GntR family transcriptional regulator [Oscillospiraceae bacterium PP1C4]